MPMANVLLRPDDVEPYDTTDEPCRPNSHLHVGPHSSTSAKIQSRGLDISFILFSCSRFIQVVLFIGEMTSVEETLPNAKRSLKFIEIGTCDDQLCHLNDQL